MNKDRRRKLSEAVLHLESASGIITDVLSEEQDSLANVPENMQDGERYSRMEDAIDYLEDALEDIASAAESIHSASEL